MFTRRATSGGCDAPPPRRPPPPPSPRIPTTPPVTPPTSATPPTHHRPVAPRRLRARLGVRDPQNLDPIQLQIPVHASRRKVVHEIAPHDMESGCEPHRRPNRLAVPTRPGDRAHRER